MRIHRSGIDKLNSYVSEVGVWISQLQIKLRDKFNVVIVIGTNEKDGTVQYICLKTVPLYHCTTVPLYHCTTVPLYHCVAGVTDGDNNKADQIAL